MRVIIIFCLIMSVLIILIGCSKTIPSFPQSPDQLKPDQIQQEISSQTAFIGSGRINLITQEIEPVRDSSIYLNVTQYIGHNFWVENAGYLPPDQYFFNLNMQNASGLTVHDVSIVFENMYGKTVINPDSYIDIFAPFDLDPYISFRKSDPNREFPAVFDSQPLIIRFPSGVPSYVDYFFIAHLGGNTGGVYEIDSIMTVDGQLTSSGGQATLHVTVRDHQDDVTLVVADTSTITGGYTWFNPGSLQFEWVAEITNSQEIPAGIYEFILMANSPASPSYNTYRIFKLEITD